MSQTRAAPAIPFTGLRGRTLARLLQLPFVRYHRVQLGFVERPRQYERFLTEIVAPRLDRLPGKLGIFGVGAHTDVALTHVPGLPERVHCFTDNNAALWRQPRFGKLVLPPQDAVTECDAFFLSTAVFQRILEQDLRRLGFTGPIVAMDDEVPPGWFLA
jgi:hypothetical protein